jgi:hypothetical protein
MTCDTISSPLEATTPLSVKRPSALYQNLPTPKRRPRPPKKRAQSDRHQHSIAPAEPDNTMPEQTHDATAKRTSKPSSSLNPTFSPTESVFSPSPQSSAATDSASSTLQSSAVTGSVPLTAQQISHFPSRKEIMKMSNAELRAHLVKAGIQPCTSIIQLTPNSC